jgi:hypothetical protein
MEKKLILTFDPIPEAREAYLRYVLGEFVPSLEQMGLRMCEAWHTAYGEYPLRLTAFVAQDEVVLDQVLSSEAFQLLETRLLDYVMNYERRIVPRENGFQF